MPLHDFREAFLNSGAAADISLAIEARTAYVALAVTDITAINHTRTRSILLLRNGIGFLYEQDQTNVSAEDGTSVILDSEDNPFVLRGAVGASAGDFDAHVETLEDRDDYDGEAANFTVWVGEEFDDAGGWYVRVTDVAGTWIGPYPLQGPPGPQGDQGEIGPTGPNVALDYQWNTATSGDPGAGKVRGNHATPASITSFAIDDVDRNGENHEALIQVLDNSTSNSKATIYVIDVADRGNWFAFSLTAAFSDQTGYWTCAVTYISHAGTIANDAVVAVLIVPTGDKGTDGAGTGDVTAASNLADNAMVVGDGGVKGVKTHASGAPGAAAFLDKTESVGELFDSSTERAATSSDIRDAMTPVALAIDMSNDVEVDLAVARKFTLAFDDDFTLLLPVNCDEGDEYTIALTASGAGHTPAYETGHVGSSDELPEINNGDTETTDLHLEVTAASMGVATAVKVRATGQLWGDGS